MKLSDYKLIYISCKFGGDKERVKLCEEFIEEFIKDFNAASRATPKKKATVSSKFFDTINELGIVFNVVKNNNNEDTTANDDDVVDAEFVNKD